MPWSIQNKLSEYQEAPPSSSWKDISRRLDEEFNASDVKLSSKLSDASIPPPENTWQAIAAALE